MDFQQYLNAKIEVQSFLLSFIDESNDDFDKLNQYLASQKLEDDHEELRQFLFFISKISNNHKRNPIFFNIIKYILLYYKNSINQIFTIFDLFSIFKNCKPILLILIDNQIISFDETLMKLILSYDSDSKEKLHYYFFFYSEIKQISDKDTIERITNELIQYDPTYLDNFLERRQKFTNDSTICQLIQKDSIESFIRYINQNNIDLNNSKIKQSIFETNRFLLKNDPTIIEYAAFYGSIQIFRYLMGRYVILTPSLWLYSIHSENPELIQILEDNKVDPPDNSYEVCLIEAIKCNHNNIANYLLLEIDKKKIGEKVLKTVFHCFNYALYLKFIDEKFSFFYLMKSKQEKMALLAMKAITKYDSYIEQSKVHSILQFYFATASIYAIYQLLQKEREIDEYLFNKQSKSIKVVLPPTIKSINDYAFNECIRLTEILLSSTMCLIGNFAFNNCDFLTEITIPSSVESIGNSAFRNCQNMKKLTFQVPSKLKTIGELSFFGCRSLTQLLIPDSVVSIGKSAFALYGGEEIIFFEPSSLISIEDSTFENSYNLKKIAIPSSVKSIGKRAFDGCRNLTDVTIPSSVKIIKEFAFFMCKLSSDFVFNSSIKYLGSYAFGSTLLKQVDIYSTKIDCCCFSYCNIQRVSFHSKNCSIKSSIFSNLDVINISDDSLFIPNRAFLTCRYIHEVIIPQSVVEIGKHAFQGCSELHKIAIPSSVKIINNYAFQKCIKLQSVTFSIPSSLEKIGNFAFRGCSSLIEIVIPTSVKTIGDNVFKYCTSLRNLTIPPTVTKIGRH